MSTYEKIATIIIGVLVVAMLVFSYHEIKEPAPPELFNANSTFDTTIGKSFTIDGYSTIASTTASGGVENNCQALQPVVIALLHDISERLQKISDSRAAHSLEVNMSTLQLFCQKNVEITLTDNMGNQLVLEKLPFLRTLPPEDTNPADIGTEIRINATVIAKGVAIPATPTTYGDILMLDRFLNAATTTPL
jgi:hypothetical protein